MLQTDAPAFVELSPSSSKSSKSNRYSDEEKEFHREEWKKSGLSMNQYCQRSGISVASLSNWANTTKSQSVTAPKIKTETPLSHSLQSVIEIVLPSGLKLRLAKATTGEIVRFIKALEVCS